MRVVAVEGIDVPDDVVVLDADLDVHGNLALVWASERGTEVSRPGARISMLGDARRVDAARWVGDDLLVWPVGVGTGYLRRNAIVPGIPCAPRDVLVADRFLYAMYGEEQFLAGTDEGDLARDRITVFSRAGVRLFGVDQLIGKAKGDPDFGEFTRGVVLPDGRLAFVADGSPLIWVLDPEVRRLSTLNLDRPVAIPDEVAAVLCDGERLGLVTRAPQEFVVAWFDFGTGVLRLEERVALPDDVAAGRARWQIRGLGVSAIAWHARTILRLV